MNENTPRGDRLREWLLSLPSLVWLAVFLVIPTVMVFAIAFRPADPPRDAAGRSLHDADVEAVALLREHDLLDVEAIFFCTAEVSKA